MKKLVHLRIVWILLGLQAALSTPGAHAASPCSAPALQAALALGSTTFSRSQLDVADWNDECLAAETNAARIDTAVLDELHGIYYSQSEQHATSHFTSHANQPKNFSARNNGRYQLDSGTRLDGWQVGADLYFGRSKGDVRGVALIWQPSNENQVALSGSGLKVTRRLR